MITKQYTTHYQSPIGTLKIRATDGGVSDVRFTDEKVKEDNESHPYLEECIDQLKEYFFEDRMEFNSMVLRYGATDFQMKVWDEVMKVPYGKTITYKELARRVGRPGAARAVGTALKSNPLQVLFPCHRVVPSSGDEGEYAGGALRKKWLLTHEGAIA